MPRKPVAPGRRPQSAPKHDKPTQAQKAVRRAAMESKGLDRATANHVTGFGEVLTLEEIAQRRIEWQRTLPKRGA